MTAFLHPGSEISLDADDVPLCRLLYVRILNYRETSIRSFVGLLLFHDLQVQVHVTACHKDEMQRVQVVSNPKTLLVELIPTLKTHLCRRQWILHCIFNSSAGSRQLGKALQIMRLSSDDWPLNVTSESIQTKHSRTDCYAG